MNILKKYGGGITWQFILVGINVDMIFWVSWYYRYSILVTKIVITEIVIK